MSKFTASALVGLAAGLLVAPPVAAAGKIVANDMGRCARNNGPAALVTVSGFKAATGMIRVQAYPATKDAWLAKGKWLTRIDTPVALADGAMQFCLPVPGAGTYGIAVRHDRNGNGKTDISQDGGGFSNNPKLSIFNLGKPSASKVGVSVGQAVTPVAIRLQYM